MDPLSIIWFRNDLRLHDNEAIIEALNRSKSVLPVYVFDERVFMGTTSYGFEKCSNFRTKFIIEAVADLRKNLEKLGSKLIVRIGIPEEIIFNIAKEFKSSWVYCNRERTHEEVEVQEKLEKSLWTIGQELRFVRGKMLYHTADLPFPISQVPDVFSNYRKEIENIVEVRKPFDKPEIFPPFRLSIEEGDMPDLATFGKPDIELRHVENKKFIGGETQGLKQLDYYLWDSKNISKYKITRNEMFGWDYSSKLSPWLAIGCISPKLVYHQLKKYEGDHIKNDSSYWLYLELLWRDFFRLMGKKYGNKIFQEAGILQKVNRKIDNPLLFTAWKGGKTGIPIIDANMKQLNETGYMSNRGRQNVASFLVKDLKINWRKGAEYFESLLIDYDPCSNYGNWNYIAGVGSDPREERYFNVVSQSKKYDSHGKYIKYWLPELKEVTQQFIHQPDTMDLNHQEGSGVFIGKDYPNPVCSTQN